MSHMDEFVDMFQPSAPELWIPVGHENHAHPDPQEQQRQGPQLFHKLHSQPPRIERTRDNFSTEDISFAKMPGIKIAGGTPALPKPALRCQRASCNMARPETKSANMDARLGRGNAPRQ
jgi:hypothetical protein